MMKNLNDKVLELIKEIRDTFKNDPELPEMIRDLTRISKILVEKELEKYKTEIDGS